MSAGAKPPRRMGPPGSEIWHSMLDGAEAILRDEGHAALTSRRIAEQIGVKQRLIYYYFRTMDDLIVETFHRLSERELQRLREARRSTWPLRGLWEICIHSTDSRLISEFIALANRIEGLGKEVVHFIEESRAIQVDALSQAMERSGRSTSLAPEALAILATSLALALAREDRLGVRSGHAEAMALIEGYLAEVEPD